MLGRRRMLSLAALGTLGAAVGVRQAALTTSQTTDAALAAVGDVFARAAASVSAPTPITEMFVTSGATVTKTFDMSMREWPPHGIINMDVPEHVEKFHSWRATLNGVDISDRCFYVNERKGEVGLYKVGERGGFYLEPHLEGPHTYEPTPLGLRRTTPVQHVAEEWYRGKVKLIPPWEQAASRA